MPGKRGNRPSADLQLHMSGNATCQDLSECPGGGYRIVRKMLGIKRSLFLAVSALAFAVIFTGCWGPSKRETSNIAISRIEEFRKAKGQLPDSLSEAGGQDSESCPCYCKTGDGSYLVWYGTTLGESETYNSETRKWSPASGACVVKSPTSSLTK
jgi:hypothetical protein